MSQRFFINPLLFAMCTAGVCTLSTITTAFGADTVPGGNVYQVQNASSKSTSVGEVSASANALSDSAKALASTDGKLTKKKIFKSTQSQAVLGKREIKGVGPAAGAAQALSLAPGIAVRPSSTVNLTTH
ncbi:hypothetical protein [Acidithiobacillus ferriphilus]|uniref:hypothetical protein n=1 Tax=Acidithiobacillus ferriphilus TaxID=1689834 RepID=UPI001D023C96|nr:hypothetical protein [Acidithiobacillus ferriphilus]